jgi:hypothetical protein
MAPVIDTETPQTKNLVEGNAALPTPPKSGRKPSRKPSRTPSKPAAPAQHVEASPDEQRHDSGMTSSGENLRQIRNPFPNAKRVKVKFFNTEGEQGKGIIDVQVNGYPFRIPREVVIELPEWVFPTIDNAIMNVLDPETKETRQVMRFPYQRINEAR